MLVDRAVVAGPVSRWPSAVVVDGPVAVIWSVTRSVAVRQPHVFL